MRAAVFKQVGLPLQIEAVADPDPAPGEVVLRVGRCGICGTDLHSTDGHSMTSPAGTVLGHEFAGEVVALGAGVERLRLGDRIAAMPAIGCGRCAGCLTGNPTWCAKMRLNFGGFAQYAISGEHDCVKLPESLSLEDGALVEPLAVALHGVRRLAIAPGAHVLVLGAGPIGLGAIYWARRLGAGRIDVVEGSPRRAEIALAMGADRCTPPSADRLEPGDVSTGWADDPSAPEIVIECVGIPGLIGQAVKKVRRRGQVLVLGFCTVADTAMIPAVANVKELTMQYSIAWSVRDFEVSTDALDAGAVEPRAMITDRVSLDALPAAFEALRHAPSQCKVLIDPWLP